VGIEVRPAAIADLNSIVELETACLGGDAWPVGLVEEGLRGVVPTTSYLVAGDPVAGHAVVSVAGDIAELQRIAVAVTRRRTGVATALLGAVVAHGRRNGADRLLLEVREDNAGAISFYAARGLVEIDRRRRYYADGTTAVVMRLSLAAADQE